MNKIAICLYPYKKISTGHQQQLKTFFPYAFLGMIGAILVNVIFFMLILSITPSYNKLFKQWKEVDKEMKRGAALKEEVNNLKKEKGEYLEGNFGQIKFDHILANIFAVLSDNIWLENIKISAEDIFIGGNIIEWQESGAVTLDNLIDKSQADKYIVGIYPIIQLRNQKKKMIGSKEVINFEIECKKKI